MFKSVENNFTLSFLSVLDIILSNPQQEDDPMNTVLTEEERELQKIYREYADERIRPHTLEIDKGLFSVEPLL